ncbi:MAG: Gfo/Idh/MocA family oxidoreductase, partial [Bacteroidales bacterium]|nr:Gfo/Idh/MocA family oxidoreductase [Bacteroidales bacterium]
MNNHIPKKEGTISSSSISPEPSLPFSRRKFIAGVSIAAAGISIVPRHVLGGKGFIAPSDKLTMALIGAGTQGLRELPELLRIPEIQLVAVCDPQKDAHGYFDWNPTSLRDHLREFSGMKEWKPGKKTNIPGGRDNAKTIVDAWYARQSGSLTGTGCRTYADFREMFEKEKDINAIKVMTPDHLHGIIAMSAMKRGMHVTLHKPVSNRLLEGLKVIQAEKSNTLTTHLIPWDYNGSMKQIMAWIKGGVIGTLQEIHNWSNRPVWPQYVQIPKESKKVPKGLDWDLWLGPEAERPYHPHYTHMVF